MSIASTWPADLLDRACADLARDGYFSLPAVFGPEEILAVQASLTAALEANTDPAIRGEEGSIYAARNVLELWPVVRTIWRKRPLLPLLTEVLGATFGLVRVLYFDKPPGQSWALPWHKDLTIAVRDNQLASEQFRKPTRKAGVPHIEAPTSVLADMLTTRIHLDPVTAENGPLKVVPGSHHTGKRLSLEGAPVRTLSAQAGDVLLIRPLVAHCSNRSFPTTRRHRRILHLEFAAGPNLPEGFAWHDFVSAKESPG